MVFSWRDLWAESSDNEPFFLPEWPLAYLRSFAGDCGVRVVSAWRGSKLRGVIPLLEEKTSIAGLPAVRLGFPGNIHSCRMSPVLARGPEREQVARALWRSIEGLPHWDLLDFLYVPEGSSLDAVLEAAEARGFRIARVPMWDSLLLRLAVAPDGSTDHLAFARQKFRANLRRAERQLKALGSLQLRSVREADPAELERFYKLEQSGWKGREGTAIASTGMTRKFYDQIAVAAAESGRLSLDFLELDGRPIAAHFGLQHRDRYYLVKGAFDEDYRRYGPGQLLVHLLLAEAPVRGIREMDWVGRATWDETRWANLVRPHLQVFVFRPGAHGRLLHDLRVRARSAFKQLLGLRNTSGIVPETVPQGFAFKEHAQNGVRREPVSGLIGGARRTLCALERLERCLARRTR